MLHITLFGHFRAALNGETISIPTKSVSALTAYLLLERAAPQPREHIAALLWPDSTDAGARTNLRQTLRRLRQALPDSPDGQPPILTENDCLLWNPAYPVEVDVFRFAAAMARAEPFLHTPLEQTPYPAFAPLQAALDLYPADLLVGFDLLNDLYARWLLPQRAKFRRLALKALARLAECYGRAGQPRRMETLARRSLTLNPDDEIAHRQLMQAFLAQGEPRAALKHYAAYEEHLAEFGEQPPPPLRILQQRAAAYREERVAPLESIPHNLPPENTPFYGRQDELDELSLRLVAPEQRLITLTGLGGIGKTRLALAVARRFIRSFSTLPPRFPGGVWFVSLADLTEDDGDSVALAILDACGWQKLPEEPALSALNRHLNRQESLLVLDNLETIPRAADIVLQLLNAVPGLTILATARQALGLQREVVHQVRSLPTPAVEGDTHAPSLDLLVERIGRITGGFQATADVQPSLIAICRLLDGWPLALELAASWADHLSVSQIADRLSANLLAVKTSTPDLPGRHRSLAAALTGSYSALSSDQQRALVRFSVFQGGCTLRAVESVLGASEEDLALLVRRNLLQQHAERYAMHAVIRQFALVKLEESGERTAVERAHAVYYLDVLRTLEKAIQCAQPHDALRQFRVERENIHRAWQWAVENDAHEQLASALVSFTRLHHRTGWRREGEALLQKARDRITCTPLAHDLLLASAQFSLRLGDFHQAAALLATLPPRDQLTPDQRLQAHLLRGMLSIEQGHINESKEEFQRALELAHHLDRPEDAVNSMTHLEILYDYTLGYEAELVAILDRTDDIWLRRQIYSYLGTSHLRHRRYDEAGYFWQKALEISLDLEDGYAAAAFYNNLGDVWRESGKHERAEDAFLQSLELARTLHHPSMRRNVLEGLARLHVLRGEHEQAVPLAQEGARLSAEQGSPYGETSALACLGHAYTGLGAWEQAMDAFSRALEVYTGAPQFALENLAGLAYVSLQKGQRKTAREYIRKFTHLLEEVEIEGYASPDLTYRRAGEVLRALGEDDQAEVVLARVLEKYQPSTPLAEKTVGDLAPTPTRKDD